MDQNWDIFKNKFGRFAFSLNSPHRVNLGFHIPRVSKTFSDRHQKIKTCLPKSPPRKAVCSIFWTEESKIQTLYKTQNSQDTQIWPIVVCGMTQCIILHVHRASDMRVWVGLCTEILKLYFENGTCLLKPNCSKSTTQVIRGHHSFGGHLLRATVPTWTLRIPFDFRAEVSNLAFRSLRFVIPNRWIPIF